MKIVGTLRASAPTFTAPLSGATCLWYRAAAQVYHRMHYGPHVVREERSQDVFVDDDSGSALVHVGPGADVWLGDMSGDWCYEPPIPNDDRNLATTENVRRYLQSHGVAIRYHRTPFHVLRTLFLRNDILFSPSSVPEKRAARYRESVLRPGDRIAVLGRAVLRPDPTAHPADGRQPLLRLVLGEAPDAAALSDDPAAWS